MFVYSDTRRWLNHPANALHIAFAAFHQDSRLDLHLRTQMQVSNFSGTATTTATAATLPTLLLQTMEICLVGSDSDGASTSSF